MATDVVWSTCHHPMCTAIGHAAVRACHARTQSTWAAPGTLPNALALESPLTHPHTPDQNRIAVSIKARSSSLYMIIKEHGSASGGCRLFACMASRMPHMMHAVSRLPERPVSIMGSLPWAASAWRLEIIPFWNPIRVNEQGQLNT